MTSLRVAFYLRVSTSEQCTANQRLELEAVAQARGWTVVGIYEDHGVSGAKGRQQRPQLDRLLKDAVRGRYDLLAAWAVDRLGRSLQDLVATLGDLQAAGVGLYLHRQAVDTSTPSGRAMFGMLSVFAEFERAMIQERVRAGLERARKAGKASGRPRIEVDQDQLQAALQAGSSIRQTAALLGVTPSKVQRMMRESGVARGVSVAGNVSGLDPA